MNSQSWAAPEEHVSEGDLGLGMIAQLDICTGTAVCSRAGDKASGSNVDNQEGSENIEYCGLWTCVTVVTVIIIKCSMYP